MDPKRAHERRPGRGRTIACVLAVAIAALVVTLASRWSPRSGVEVARALQVVCAAAFAVVAFLRGRREPRQGWWALSVFGACWLASRAAALSAPRGTLGALDGPLDAVWVLGAPAGLFGVYRQCFGQLVGRTRARVVSDALVVALALLLVGWVVFHEIDFHGVVAAPGMELLVPAFEVLGGSLVLTAAVYQPHRRSLRWLAAACYVAVLGDASLAHQSATGHVPGGPLELAVMVATPLLLLRFASGHDLAPAPGAGSSVSVTSPRRLLVYVPAGLALVGGTWEVVAHGGMYGLAGALGMALAMAVMVNHTFVSGETFELLRLLRTSEARFRVTFDEAPVGMAVTRGDSTLVQANAALADLVGRSVDDVVGLDASDLLGEPPAALEDLRHRLRRGLRTRFVHEAEVVRPDGTRRWARITTARVEQSRDDLAAISVVEDVTAQHDAQARLVFLANHDPLTGLDNRHRLDQRLSAVLREADDERPAALLITDLDQFKLVNDSLGHAAGDHLLQVCARRLVDAVGGSGSVARIGGDEFCIVFDPAMPDEHRVAVDRVAAAVRGPVALAGAEVHYPTTSMGATLSRAGASSDRLTAEADAALYRAKERGRNRVEWYERGDGADPRSAHRLVTDLHRGLERHELFPHFQPVVDLATGRTVAVESLVRWRHPDRGLLEPAAFLPIAEGSGLMVPLGRHLLAEACRTVARWNAELDLVEPLSVSVNLAAQQLVEAGFDADVRAVVEDTGLDPSLLWLEITESALMTDVRATDRTLRGLRDLGAHLSIDDFGTGYSSLTYLKRFPVESLKIDRSFVSGLGTDRGDTTIVELLVELARRLDLSVVAEGIETPEQQRLLSGMGCDFGQGYLFGRPMPAGALAQRLVREAGAQPAAALPWNATGSPGFG